MATVQKDELVRQRNETRSVGCAVEYSAGVGTSCSSGSSRKVSVAALDRSDGSNYGVKMK